MSVCVCMCLYYYQLAFSNVSKDRTQGQGLLTYYSVAGKLLMCAQLIDEATQETFGHVNKQLTENQLNAVAPDAYSVDLVISSQSVQFL